MKMERIICVFKKTEETLFKEINGDLLKLPLIEKLFIQKERDENFYMPYKIEQPQYDEIVKVISELKDYKCEEYDMYLEAVTV